MSTPPTIFAVRVPGAPTRFVGTYAEAERLHAGYSRDGIEGEAYEVAVASYRRVLPPDEDAS